MTTGQGETARLYGIQNCDTVKKARQWLADSGLAYQFHDLRKDGLDSDMIARWGAIAGIETLLNKRSTTWKGLPDSVRNNLDSATIPALLVANPTLVKRPVLEADGKVLVGFSATAYSAFFHL